MPSTFSFLDSVTEPGSKGQLCALRLESIKQESFMSVEHDGAVLMYLPCAHATLIGRRHEVDPENGVGKLGIPSGNLMVSARTEATK